MYRKKREITPLGEAKCSSCGGRFGDAELLAVHLSASTACCRDMVERGRIQLLGEWDDAKRLMLTESLHVVTEVKKRKKNPVVATLWGVSVLGNLLVMDTWWNPADAKRDLFMRTGQTLEEGVIEGELK